MTAAFLAATTLLLRPNGLAVYESSARHGMIITCNIENSSDSKCKNNSSTSSSIYIRYGGSSRGSKLINCSSGVIAAASARPVAT